MPTLQSIYGNITEIRVDAIVNAANQRLLPGGGVCGAIHDAAGPELEIECRTLNGCDYGEAKITSGYKLPASFVIHTVGPIYGQHNGNERSILYSCYYESLRLAERNRLTSIAFPALATGTYGYPSEAARQVSIEAITDYFSDNKNSSIQEVHLVTYPG